MMNIRIATIADSNEIYEIGKKSFIASHNKSGSEKDINAFVKMYYTPLSITQELKKPTNNYFLISQNSALFGFSNIELNCKNSNIPSQNSSKLDRIYFLEEAFGKGFGKILLKFNIDFSIKNEQEGIWLYTWTGNHRAIKFYKKNGFEIIGNYDYKISDTHSNPNHIMYLKF